MADQQAPSRAATGDEKRKTAPEFDVTTALERVDGDKELLEEIAQLFLQDVPQMTPDLRKAAAELDTAAIDHLTHKIKGSVGNVGGTAAHEAALQVEELVTEGRVDAIPAAVDRLIQEIDRLAAALEKVVAEGIPG